MKALIKQLFLLCLFLPTLGLSNALQESDILGIWINQAGDGLIEIKQNDKGHYVGIIVGSTDGKDRNDVNNSDPARQSKSLLYVTIMDEFNYVGDLTWEDGWIYDPNDGNTYSCKMTLLDDKTLKIRGYIGITFFGRTEIWQKAKLPIQIPMP